MAASDMLIYTAAFMLLYIWVGLVSLPYVVRFLTSHGVTSLNFRQDTIPNGLGLFVWYMLIVYFFLLQLGMHLQMSFPLQADTLLSSWVDAAASSFPAYVIILTIVFVVGWLDDSLGDKTVKGLRGHWSKWRNEKTVTTGMLKAVVTVFLSVWVVFIEFNNTLLIGIAKCFLIALMTNTMNLLDLRPGRALKGFFFIASLLLFLSASLAAQILYLLPVWIGALLVLPKDLHAQAMLGDAGANLIGFALGFTVIAVAPLWFQMFMLAILGWLHWFAERSSITRYIEEHRWLRWLDQLGRT
jgi:UDP-GlcNAc:undecaprenyl-phosphate GlcNAc-1-phosphate transferase